MLAVCHGSNLFPCRFQNTRLLLVSMERQLLVKRVIKTMTTTTMTTMTTTTMTTTTTRKFRPEMVFEQIVWFTENPKTEWFLSFAREPSWPAWRWRPLWCPPARPWGKCSSRPDTLRPSWGSLEISLWITCRSCRVDWSWSRLAGEARRGGSRATETGKSNNL